VRGCGNRALWFYHGEWVCDPCYKAEEFRPGHWPIGDKVHFFGLCNDCNARYAARMSLEEAERWYRSGHFSQDVWEAFTHVWATSAFRFGYYGSWRRSPAIPEVVRLVAIMRGQLALRVTAKPRRAHAYS
jgi:hypothetical protein